MFSVHTLLSVTGKSSIFCLLVNFVLLHCIYFLIIKHFSTVHDYLHFLLNFLIPWSFISLVNDRGSDSLSRVLSLWSDLSDTVTGWLAIPSRDIPVTRCRIGVLRRRVLYDHPRSSTDGPTITSNVLSFISTVGVEFSNSFCLFACFFVRVPLFSSWKRRFRTS